MNHWNKNVAKSRGREWKKKIMAGKLEARINPTTLRLVRVKKGLTQTDLAQSLGLTYATYGAYENGRRLIKSDVAAKISEAVGAATTKLFTKKKDKYIARRASGAK